MKKDNYDKTSVESIYVHALNLVGKNLVQATTLPTEIVNKRNRGDLGRLIEKYYFHHNPPNDHEPDFKEAKLELKTTGIVDYKKPTKKGNTVRAKERLVLNTINYRTIIFENFENSTFLHKCALMLVLFYKYDRAISSVEQIFSTKPLLILLNRDLLNENSKDIEFIKNNSLRISENDLEIIKRDWELIRQKIADNRAHELSEGDTFYLGACRKGSGGKEEPLKKQMGSEIGAKSRAFAFKQSFVTKLLQGQSPNEVTMGIGRNISFEDLIKSKFEPYLGKTQEEISVDLNYFTRSKSRKWLLANRILARGGEKIEEFEKAGILMKTVSLSYSGKSREDMSFPAFEMNQLLNQEWEDSDFASQIENKFLFIIFREGIDGKDRLEKVMYWNMPHSDRLEAKRVWEDAKRRLNMDASNLPKKSESDVAHVRPHAKNRKDVDISLHGEVFVKRCFWLNSSYISKVVK